jgi:hypothetical protein
MLRDSGVEFVAQAAGDLDTNCSRQSQEGRHVLLRGASLPRQTGARGTGSVQPGERSRVVDSPRL